MVDDTQIITLKIKLGTAWGAEIEFLLDSTLSDLHFAIQDVVDFDNHHLYEFYISKNERSRNRTAFACHEGDCDLPISDIFPLPPRTSLFYFFDFGDCWIFKINATRKKLKPPEAGIAYPRLLVESGEKPIQYDSIEFD